MRSAHSHGGRKALVLMAVITALLALPSGASAARDPIASGTTDLHMKKGFLRKIANVGVTVGPVGSGVVSGNKISVPVVTGKLDPTNVQGWLEASNGFKLIRGERGVPITRLTVNTVGARSTRRSPRRTCSWALSSPPSPRGKALAPT